MAVVDIFSGDKWTASPTSEEVKESLISWSGYSFTFTGGCWMEFSLVNLKTRLQQFHPKKKPSAAERRRGEEGELPELVSPWASLFYGAHHGHWWKSREKIQEGKRKFQFPNFTQKHKSSLTAEVIVLVSSFIFKIKQAFLDQVEGLRVLSWGLQDIYAIIVTRIMHL